MTVWCRPVWLVTALLLGGCGSAAVVDTSVRTDSAGIEIVLSDPGEPRWRGHLEPILTLGTVGAGGPEEFYQIQDLEFLDSTTIAVADRGSEEVRVFSLNGTFLHRFGGPGRGPAEFRRLQMVAGLHDSILTYDGGNDRVGVRDADGELVRSFRLEWFGRMVFPVDLSASGDILAATASHMTELHGTGVVVDTSVVSLYDVDGMLIDSIARLPHNERFVKQVGDMRTTVGAPFTAIASLVATTSGFCHAFGPFAEVRCFDRSGTLKRIARLREEPRPVTAAHVERYWDDLWADAEGSYRNVMLRVRDDLVFPSTFPAISALVVDDEGRVWTRRFRVSDDDPDHWWVFEDGSLAGVLSAPPGLEVFDVERGLVAGVWHDDLDVEHVRVYRLVRQ